MDKIFSGKDRARELKLKNYREMVSLFAARNGRTWNGSMNNDPAHALLARIDAGRWISECECHEAFFVDPQEPFAYCARCGNIAHGGRARMVIFPEDRDGIENALLEREIKRPDGMQKMTTQDIGISELVFPNHAPRNWEPGQSPQDLRDEHKKLKDMIEKQKERKVTNG